VSHLNVSDNVLHFCAYVALSSLPVIGFRNRQQGIVVGLSMFVLSLLLEAGQHFAPGRAVEFRDVLANGAGVSCGTLMGLPIRTLAAIV
jgi:VanZ family protein